MEVGDLVRGWYTEGVPGEEERLGIVIEVINSDYQVPPVCKILWPSGEIEKEWTDDIDIVDKALTHEQLENVQGGMSLEAFSVWRARQINEKY